MRNNAKTSSFQVIIKLTESPSDYTATELAKCLGGPVLCCSLNSGKNTGTVPCIQPKWPQNSSKSTHGKPSLSSFKPFHCHLTLKAAGRDRERKINIIHQKSVNGLSRLVVNCKTIVLLANQFEGKGFEKQELCKHSLKGKGEDNVLTRSPLFCQQANMWLQVSSLFCCTRNNSC